MSTATITSGHYAASTASRSYGPAVPARRRAGVVGSTVAIAVAVNASIYLACRAAGVSFAIDGERVPAAGVAVLTAVPLALGMSVAALVAARFPALLRAARVIGPALALLTISATIAV